MTSHGGARDASMRELPTKELPLQPALQPAAPPPPCDVRGAARLCGLTARGGTTLPCGVRGAPGSSSLAAGPWAWVWPWAGSAGARAGR